MGLPVEVNMLLASSSGYNISRSLRLRNSASAYLTRTPASNGNQQRWTTSFWYKPGRFGSQQPIITSYTSVNNYALIGFSLNAFINANDTFKFYVASSGTTQVALETTAVYRDPSAWYHVVVAVDTTQAISTNRVLIYVNGVQVTSFSTATYPALNASLVLFNTTNPQQIGALATGTYGYYDGYMAEFNWIDGQQLTPSSFGEFDPNGIWNPKKYAGTYGTNGFYLPFNTTTATGFSSYYAYFNGNSQYLSMADSAAFDLAASDFTVEAWLNPSSSGAATARNVLNQSSPGASSNSAFYFGAGSDGIALYLSTSGTSWTNFAQTSIPVPVGQWSHVVWQRRGNTLEIYLNGSLQTVTSGSSSFSGTVFNSSRSVEIGTQNAAGAWFYGSISNLRLVKGTAVYTSNFTPPTSALTAVANTQLLTLQNATFVDNSTNNFSITNNNSLVSTLSTVGNYRTITKDSSGNYNDWYTNNISLTVGTGRYLGSISGSIDTTNGGPASSLFKGSTTDPGVYPNPGVTLTWSPFASIPFTSTARVFIGVDVNGPSTGLVVNSTNYGAGGLAGNAFGWVNVASAGSPITSISWTRAGGGSQGMRVYAIEIDGVILTDSPTYNPIYDSMTDVPTNSVAASNYCVWNRLATTQTVTGGNLDVSIAAQPTVPGTIGVTSGKWYWEIIPGSTTSGGWQIGVVTNQANLSAIIGADAYGWAYVDDARKRTNNTPSAYGASFTTNDVIGVALDMDAGTITFYKNNISQGQAFSGITGTVFPAISTQSASLTSTASANFGQRPFTYTPPSGFKALNTFNLPDPSIKNGALHFAATAYTGTGTNQSISNGKFQPDLVWAKSRSTNTYDTVTQDSVVGAGNVLRIPNTGSVLTGRTDILNGFTSTGFSVGTDQLSNLNTGSYIGWQWKGGGAAVTNNSGNITSQVSVNQTAGFSIVTWTGTGVTGGTVGHGLSTFPWLVIIKKRNVVDNWYVATYAYAQLNYAFHYFFNTTGAVNGNNDPYYLETQTSLTSPVLRLSDGSGGFNGGNQLNTTYVAYCWTPINGYSAIGSYTGTANADGPFIYTGFRPRWLMVKRSDAVENWYIVDSTRNIFNVMNGLLKPNSVDSEGTTNVIDFTSNGFKVRESGTGFNGSGGTYIYAAFAENPFKYSRAR